MLTAKLNKVNAKSGVTLLLLSIVLSSGCTPLPIAASPAEPSTNSCYTDASQPLCVGVDPVTPGVDQSAQHTLTDSSAKAFPGAEGFGSKTPGGRGGRVLMVDSLSDNDNKGTLRWAIDQSGPRLVIFKTGGLIKLKKRLVIENPYITIAGQTAPGSGITLGGGQQFAIRTHDVIIRGLRSRPGDGPGAPGSQRDAISIGRASNVVIDHCSFTWATDENVTIWFAARDITLSWNIIAQALADSIHEKGRHSMGMIVGDNSHRISIHKNLFASNLDRNPLLTNAYQVELINNYIYGWGDGGVKVLSNTSSDSTGKPVLHAEGNFLQHGAGTLARPGIKIDKGSDVYLNNNIDTHFPTNSDEQTTASARYQKNSLFQQSGIDVKNIQYVQEQVLSNAGTTSNQHSIDKAIIKSVEQKSAMPINSVGEMGGYGDNFRGTPAVDSDGDGIPNWFEKKQGFNISQNDANDDADHDGYTNIEEYINSFYEE